MENLSRVSIIASTYKSEKFLSEWLKSIEDQHIWSQAELIVVANDPSEKEITLLREFEKKYPHQVILKVVPREGLYTSWNRAASLSHSQILAIGNVDDIRAPASLLKQVELLEQNQGASFCYGSYEVVDQFGKRAGAMVMPPAFDINEYTRGMHLGPFFVWRFNASEPNQYFDEQFKSGGDFDFAVRLALSGNGIRVSESLGFYLNCGAGLSTGNILQPIERTVVELRYGIWDKIDVDFIPAALEYDLKRIKVNGSWVSLVDLMSNYKNLLDSRKFLCISCASKKGKFMRRLNNVFKRFLLRGKSL